MRTHLVIPVLASTLALAACGGGGGASTGSMPPVVATMTPATQTASARGTLVDAATSAPLAGVRVALAPWQHGAPIVASATTANDGSFSVGASPGTYLLVAGSDAATDPRATLHLRVALVAGATTVTGPVPATEPDVTYTPAQLGGTLRLALLSSDEQNCIAAANVGRQQAGLAALVPDELLLEQARAELSEQFAQDTDTPSPLYPAAGAATFVFPGLVATTHSEQDFPTCGSWSGPAYSYQPNTPPYTEATSAANVWYAAAFAPKGSTAISHASYGAQFWEHDPRP